MLKGKALDIGKSSAIIDWKVEKLDSDRSSLKLSWKYSEEKKKVRQFILYRSTDNSPLSTYKVILRNESVLLNQSNTRTQSFEFFDQELKPRRKYKYQIIAKLSDGSYSPLSDLVEIKS